MDEVRIESLTRLLTVCHGKDAEAVARKRAARCRRRNEADWSLVWQEVANRLSQRAITDSVAVTGE
jgi:hypothetical protein